MWKKSIVMELLFADDRLIFTKPDVESVTALQGLLEDIAYV